MARNGDIVYEIGGDASSLIAAGEAGAQAMRKTDKAVDALKKQIDNLASTSSKYQRQLNATIGVTDNFGKSAKASAAVFTRDWDRAVGQVDRLRTQLDPLYASSMRYQTALEQLDAAMKAGVITQAEHGRLLGLAGQAYLQTGSAAVASAGKMGGFASVVNNNRAVVQMFGYQVQDVAVQLSAGTRATTVFAQQGSQMLGVLGPYGAIAGAALAVTLPLAGAFISAGDGAKTFAGSISKLEEAVRLVDDVINNYSLHGLEELKKKYGEVDGAVLALIEHERQWAVMQAEIAATDTMNKLASDFGVLGMRVSETGVNLGNVERRILNLRDRIGLTTSETYQLVNAMNDAANAKDHLARADALQRVADLLLKSRYSAEEVTGEVIKAEAAMRRLATAVPGAGWLSGMISEAAAVGQKLWDAVRAKAALGDGAAPTGVRPKARPDGMEFEVSETGGYGLPDGGKGGGGGGGGKQDQAQADLERLQQQFMSEAELQLKAYEDQQLIMDQALQKKLLTQQEYNELMQQAQADHQRKMSDIDVWRYGDGLQQAETFFGGMADAMQSGNERMQRIGRIFGAAEALINAWRAFNQVLADPKLPFFAKLPAAASVLAAGMNAVNAIKGGGHGGGGGASRGSSGSAQAQQQQPLSVRLTEFNPNGLYSGAAIGSLLDSLTKEAGDRGYRLMVAR